MKFLIVSVFICVVVGGATYALRAGVAPKTQPTQPGDKAADAKPVNKFCAIEKDSEVDPKVTTTYDGKVIGFCCDECIPTFKKDPAKYMKGLK